MCEGPQATLHVAFVRGLALPGVMCGRGLRLLGVMWGSSGAQAVPISLLGILECLELG
jgi:hypothetical protein